MNIPIDILVGEYTLFNKQFSTFLNLLNTSNNLFLLLISQ